MKKGKRPLTKKIAVPLATAVLLSSLVACSSDKAGSSEKSKEGTNEIKIMTTAYSTEPPKENSPALKALEKYTKTDITVNYVVDAYPDKLNITLASGNLPHILMIPDKIPSFVSAVRDGAFWELGPYLKDYPNLKEANEVTLQNSSIDGKIYGIYRARPLGRNGITMRKDWLDNLGLEKPETVEEFYNVLKAFTQDDPDGNGKDDTYGMVISKYFGPFDIMQLWFGAPNKWGEDQDGKLYPDFTTDEYLEALKFFKKLYDEKLINEDFAVMDPLKWGDPMMNNQAGVIVDVLDRAYRTQEDMIKANPDLKDPITVLPGVEGPDGLRLMPTAGYSGMLAIPKTSVKTEEELKKVLTFIDKLSDKEAQIIAYNGIEGKHYEMKDGKFESLAADDKALQNEYTDLNQFYTGIPENRFLEAEKTPLRKEVEAMMIKNEENIVPNPAAALISDVYATNGQQLDNIINDARTKFIVGQIDEAGFKDAIELWKKSGGDKYVEEINKLHKEAQK
ncbi:extracellular solute-binding protein [Mesobacillus foraminis]|uniref:extracellular solute-binding protein n=1 Tax=Mesobacillus foraminis TaxID=279826 RepID=UPI001BEBAAB4|nr:extracellular solute-binding protein [Mesobacillus foraminis]MBT2758873.1 extracellular solute-binding protein [Mesobacillus foraminis]